MSTPSRRSRLGGRPRPRGPVYLLRPVGGRDVRVVGEQRAAMFRDMGEISERKIVRYGPVFNRWFRRELRRGNLSGVLVATPTGEVVAGGLLWRQPRTPSPRFPQQRVPYVMSVYTSPSHRQRGLATRVVRALVATARREGFPRVELHATEVGRGLYTRLGFGATNQMRLTLRGPRSVPRPGRVRRRGARS
jgi:GNAT superfamily N-acetyltransferase